MNLDAIALVFDVIVALSAVVVMRYVESNTGFRIGPTFRSARERELEREVHILRDRVVSLEAQYREAVEQEVIARRELEVLRDEIDELRKDVAKFGQPGFKVERSTLLVATASGGKFWMDLAATRSAPVPMSLIRLKGVTRAALKKHLDRGRRLGRPVELLHVACHSAGGALAFDDGAVDGEWLSEHLIGVKVALLAGCNTDDVGDWLGVVPYVVTLTEEVSDEDAAAFAQLFWSGIARGVDPDGALAGALERAPSGMGEFIEHHW